MTLFDDVEQTEISLGTHRVPWPDFIRSASAVHAAFPARLRVLREMLPDRTLRPLRIGPGLGVLGVSAIEYLDSDLGAYREVSVAVALAGGLLRRRVEAYVSELPVTTELARLGGRVFSNYPKWLAQIDLRADVAGWTARLAEGGEPILGLRASAPPTRPGPTLTAVGHSWLDGQTQSSEIRVHALELGIGRPGAARLELGPRHPVARTLARALVSSRSLGHLSMPRWEGIFFSPDRMTPALLERMRRVTAGAAVGVSSPAS